MKALAFDVTCPRCGSALEPVNIGRPIAGTETKAIVRCTSCRPEIAEWLVAVRMAPVNLVMRITAPSPVTEARCGTESGYTRHVRTGTRPCDACKEAHASAERRRVARRQREGVLV